MKYVLITFMLNSQSVIIHYEKAFTSMAKCKEEIHYSLPNKAKCYISLIDRFEEGPDGELLSNPDGD